MTQKAVVLLSGGIDSSTVLGFAIRDVGFGNVTAISVDYGQRHVKELEQAKKVAAYMLVAHEVFKYPAMQKGGLTDHQADIPNVDYKDIVGVSPTYVPFRNGTFLSLMAGIMASRLQEGETGAIYFGAHAEDAAGDAYPDCRMDFVGAMAAAIYIGTYHKVQVRAPIISMYKDEIVQAGQKLGIPWDLTWSCYKGESLHCGICPTCRARQNGFRKAGIPDPTQYAEVPA